jgi:hypothetical protein
MKYCPNNNFALRYMSRTVIFHSVEPKRELGVHLGKFSKQCRKYKKTRREVWVHMDNRSEDSMHDQRLSSCK